MVEGGPVTRSVPWQGAPPGSGRKKGACMQEMVLDRENSKILDLFQHLKGFSVFSDQELLSFVKMGRIREYEPGETIINQGEFDCWVYILISGALDIEQGGQIVSALKRCGDMFGEMGVIDGSPRSATIKARSRSLVLGFDASVIDNKLKENHISFCYTLYRLFAEVLAVRLRETTKENIRLKEELAQYQG